MLYSRNCLSSPDACSPHLKKTRVRMRGRERERCQKLPSSIMAVVTFLPVIPCAQANYRTLVQRKVMLFTNLPASTFKSSFGLPPFWPTFFYEKKTKFSL